MFALFFGLLALCATRLVSSQSIDKFLISTSAGDDAVQLSVALIWDSVSYSCVFTPSSGTNNALTCDDSIWVSETPVQPDQPFYVRVEWDSPDVLLDISSINVTLLNGDWFLFEDFCIHSKMVCTVQSDLTSTGACGQWSSKEAYSSMAIGSTSKFSLLYFDIRSDIVDVPNLANTVREVSVRPPNLVSMSYLQDGSSDPTVTLTANVQWDNKLYQCSDIPTNTPNIIVTCDFTDVGTDGVASNVQCPGKASDFWWSVYNPSTVDLGVINVTISDETGTTYSFSILCQPLVSGSIISITSNEPPYCTVINDQDEYLKVGPTHTATFAKAIYTGNFFDPLAAFKAPAFPQQQCIFAYPDETNPAEIEVENVVATDFGWDVDQFGGPDAPECLNTSSPTAYPTINPTTEPTFVPTMEPTTASPTTGSPSTDPTVNPTSLPSLMPTEQPTTAEPTEDPTSDPTEVPTTAEPTEQPTDSPSDVPTTVPTRIPTAEPTTMEPTASPSFEPTFEPTEEPTMEPTEDPTKEPTDEDSSQEEASDKDDDLDGGVVAGIVVGVLAACCLLWLLLFLLMKRRKEEEKEMEQQTETAVKDTADAGDVEMETQEALTKEEP